MKWSLLATVAFVAVELAAGVTAHSLALIADAGHNFTDALALLLAWFGARLETKPADEVKTYGYHRAGVLAAFVNAGTLVLLALWIVYASLQRLRTPETVNEVTMLVVAVAGLVVNVSIMRGLHHGKAHDLNVRAAYLHMAGDAIGSLAIIVGAVVIRATGWLRVDPVLSMLIGGLIIWTAWDIIGESLNILLEGLPRGMSLQDVIGAMAAVEGVLDVHDLHIWSLGSRAHALSSHVVIADVPPSESEAILQRIGALLASRFQIHHATIQFEHRQCAVSGDGCPLPGGLAG